MNFAGALPAHPRGNFTREDLQRHLLLLSRHSVVLVSALDGALTTIAVVVVVVVSVPISDIQWPAASF